jgi:hypothetical protein
VRNVVQCLKLKVVYGFTPKVSMNVLCIHVTNVSLRPHNRVVLRHTNKENTVV